MSSFTHHVFRHGVHPPEFKEDTRLLAIKRFAFAPLMELPLLQHIGKPSVPVVKVGEEVQRGQMIAKADGFLSVPLHAPVSGRVKKIDWMPAIGGGVVQGIYLQTLAASTQEVVENKPCILEQAGAQEIVQAIQDAGIVGLGGAMYPTHAKFTLTPEKKIDTLVVNGAECEPYLTTDHRVMLEQSADIVTGIRYLLKACQAQRAIIGVERNKGDAAEVLRKHIPPQLPVTVELLPVKYPQGAEKMLIKTLLGREVMPGMHSYDVGVVGTNVATAAEIGRLLPLGRGIQERVITIAGSAVKEKGNYRIPIGTPLRFVLEQVGVCDDVARVILGGPMMGQAVPNLDIAITKGISAVIAFTRHDLARQARVYNCICCGYCVQACPMGLDPSQLVLLAMNDSYEDIESRFHVMDCFECGACAYVCPAHIPLVQYFRVAKQMWKKLARKQSLLNETQTSHDTT